MQGGELSIGSYKREEMRENVVVNGDVGAIDLSYFSTVRETHESPVA